MRTLQQALEDLDKNSGRSAEIRAYRDKVQQMDAEALLEYYGARNVSSSESRYGTQYIHSCLIDTVEPHHSHGDESPSASLQGENLLYNCWSYGGGDLFWFLNIMEDGDQKAIREVLTELYSGALEKNTDILNEINEILTMGSNGFVIPTYSEKVLEKWKWPHPALYEGRGIDPQVLLDYGVGFDTEAQEHIIPHFWKGDLVGWQRRRQDDERWATSSSKSKYKNTTNFPKSETLYGFDRVEGRDVALVVESVMSVLKARTYESLAEDENVKLMLSSPVATFGAKMTQLQSEYLRVFDDVVLWYDDDEAGKKATQEAVKLLEPFVNVYVVDHRGQKDDLAGLSFEEVNEKLQTLTPSFLAMNIWR